MSGTIEENTPSNTYREWQIQRKRELEKILMKKYPEILEYLNIVQSLRY